MGEPWFPDPARSRAVLIGVSRYQAAELPAIPAVRDNLRDLRAVLTDPAGGTVPADGCVRLGDDSDHARVGSAVATAADQARDLLLVYYAGHGVLDRDGKLHLALGSTDPDHLAWTAIPHDLIRRELGRSRAKARVLILDCCFSGRAVEAMSGTGSLVAGQLKVTGTFTLTSTTATEPAHAPLGERHTAFTGALLRALASPKPLTLDDIYRHTEDELIGLGLPSPQCQSVNTARDVALIRVPPSPPQRNRPTPRKTSNLPKPEQPTNRPKPKSPSPTPTAAPTTTPAPSGIRRTSYSDPSWQSPATPGSTRRPLSKAISAIVLSAAAAVFSVIAFTDAWANGPPGVGEYLINFPIGIGIAVSAVVLLVNAVKYLREARRQQARKRQSSH